MDIYGFARNALAASALFFLSGAISSSASAQAVRLEIHPLPTTTLTDREFLTGAREGKPVVIAAELRIPRAGSDRLPAVVLVHGSGGAGAREAAWADHLNRLGIATLTLDGFTGRGITSTGENQALLPRLAMIVDAYRALDLLAKHPRIDAGRVALMGFSRGGQTTLYASLKRFRRLQGSPGVEFAAYLPFYAPCSTTYIDDVEVSDKPIRLFHGGADDYNPVSLCRPYVERLRAAGKNVQLFEYPGAHHVFDNALGGPPRPSPRSQTVRNCTLQETTAGVIINAKTNQPFTYDDPCVERGVTMGYDADAHAKALMDVTQFLRETLKLRSTGPV